MASVQIELKFTGHALSNKDLLSKSDPQVFVFQRVGESENIYQGSTEKIKNNLNPVFQHSVKIDYFFEVCQSITVLVVDIDGSSSKKAYKDFGNSDIIGMTRFNLGHLLTQPGLKAVYDLNNPNQKFAGSIIVGAEFINKSSLKAYFTMVGTKFDKKDVFGKSDPYYKVLKLNPDGTHTEVYKSEVIKETLNPTWKDESIWMDDLCNSDPNRPLRFQYYDWDRVGDHDLIGQFDTTWAAILSPFEFQLINPKKKSSSSYTNSGTVRFENPYTAHKFNMLQFLQGGLKMDIMFAIDCTFSNGEIRHEGSLHHVKEGETNHYEKSLLELGSVLMPYNPTQQAYMYGYGARTPTGSDNPNGRRDFYDKVDHCFFFNRSGNPCPKGPEQLHEYYKKNIGMYYFDGPTNFAPIIRHASSYVKDYSQTNQKYMVLVIITDGDITDMEETKEEIAKASNLPFSIVIVGVGYESFDRMKELDADKYPIISKETNLPVRDIVQFVPLMKVLKSGNIAKETLKEIPNQLVSHYKLANIVPNPPSIYVSPQLH